MLCYLFEVSCSIQLPEGAHLHDVFHVGLLKPFHGEPPSSPTSLTLIKDGFVVATPTCVQRARCRDGAWEVLVEWLGLPVDDAIWEPCQAFAERYLDFRLEDELFA